MKDPIAEVKGGEVKKGLVRSFLLGTSFGIGITLVFLLIQKPEWLIRPIDTLVEIGRMRRAKGKKIELWKEKLREAGFSDEEIKDGISQ